MNLLPLKQYSLFEYVQKVRNKDGKKGNKKNNNE